MRATKTRGARSGDSGLQRSSAKYPRAGQQQDRSKRSGAAGRQASPCIAILKEYKKTNVGGGCGSR